MRKSIHLPSPPLSNPGSSQSIIAATKGAVTVSIHVKHTVGVRLQKGVTWKFRALNINRVSPNFWKLAWQLWTETENLKITPNHNGQKWRFAYLAFPSWTEMEVCRFCLMETDGNRISVSVFPFGCDGKNKKTDTSLTTNFKQP